MHTFGAESERQLITCHSDLQRIARDVIQYFDFSVIEGHRGQVDQDADFAKGVSKLKWPDGKHNGIPSKAFDIEPYPIDWSDKPDAIRRSCYLAGFVMATARRLGIKLRWGGDWNRNDDTRDEHGLRDWGHFELDD